MVICLGWPSPATSSSLPAAVSLPPLALGPGWAVWVTPRRLFGLAPTGGYRATAVASGAVGSYPTVSPLPPLVEWRSVFCGPVRRLTAPRCYLAVYPLELGLSSEVAGKPTPPRPPHRARFAPPIYRPGTPAAIEVVGTKYLTIAPRELIVATGGHDVSARTFPVPCSRHSPYTNLTGSVVGASSPALQPCGGRHRRTHAHGGPALLYPAPGLPAIPLLPGVLIYGCLANLCYSAGWISELGMRMLWRDQAPPAGPVLWRQGLLFSVGLTLMPAVLAAAAWALRLALLILT